MQRMLYFLFYIKDYPTEEHLALMTQPQINQWKQVLRQILKECFEKMEVLPARQTKDLNKVFRKFNVKTFIVDTTERFMNRLKDSEVQEEFYSGKKSLFS